MARFILSDLSVWPTVDIRSNGYKSIEDMQGGENMYLQIKTWIVKRE